MAGGFETEPSRASGAARPRVARRGAGSFERETGMGHAIGETPSRQLHPVDR